MARQMRTEHPGGIDVITNDGHHQRIGSCISAGFSARLLLPVLLAFWMSTFSLPAFTLLSSNQLVFVNVDHAPMGACSTMAYGYKGDVCGVGTSTGFYPYWNSSSV